MAATSSLRFPLRAATYRTLIGLLAATGMRVGEAIRLLAETHRATPNAFRSATVTGLTRIAADKGFSRDRLREVLKRFDLGRLIGEAHTLANGGNVGTAVERIVRAAMQKRAA